MTYDEFQNINPEYILEQVELHKNDAPEKIALKLSNQGNKYASIIAEQVACYRKAKLKLPLISSNKLLYDKTALEQSSGEATAIYKSQLISGKHLIDLTGGLGIDDIHFSNHFNTITYCEQNKVVSSIFKYNIKQLQIKNISVKNTDSVKYLSEQADNLFDWIYIDPSRRNNDRRSVDLAYCTPNVYEHLELFFRKSEQIMIKAAPAYDITEAIRKFSPYLSEIHAIAVNGECKEILLLLNKSRAPEKPAIFSVALNSKNTRKKTFNFKDKCEKHFSEAKQYLFVPDCSIIKSGNTSCIAEKFGFMFINNNTHYLTADNTREEIPGRYFKITAKLKFNDKGIKSFLKINGIKKANVASKGFPLSVDDIRKRFKIKDGGTTSLFFTSDWEGKNILLVCIAERFENVF